MWSPFTALESRVYGLEEEALRGSAAVAPPYASTEEIAVRDDEVDASTSASDELRSSTAAPAAVTWKRHNYQKVRGQVKVAWNNLRHGWTWKRKSSFSESSAIWLLGKLYEPNTGAEATNWYVSPPPVGSDCGDLVEADFDDFMADFTSRIWLTYRTGFAHLVNTKLNSDCGWGCQLRTGQMLIAQALQMHLLGRDWNIFAAHTADERRLHRDILRYFGDSHESALSLHRLVMLGEFVQGKAAGEWYGPAAAAQLLREAFLSGTAQTDARLSQLAVHVARDCTLAVADVDALCGDGAGGAWHKALVLIVPLRLGAERTNADYLPQLTFLFSTRHCLGLMGGRPKHSMFFIGCQDQSLVYLDPHNCQPTVDTSVADFPIKSFHCRWPRKLNVAEMDSSCAVGFYCRHREDLLSMLDDLDVVIHRSDRATTVLPLFSVVQSADELFPPDAAELDSRRQSDTLCHGFVLL